MGGAGLTPAVLAYERIPLASHPRIVIKPSAQRATGARGKSRSPTLSGTTPAIVNHVHCGLMPGCNSSSMAFGLSYDKQAGAIMFRGNPYL